MEDNRLDDTVQGLNNVFAQLSRLEFSDQSFEDELKWYSALFSQYVDQGIKDIDKLFTDVNFTFEEFIEFVVKIMTILHENNYPTEICKWINHLFEILNTIWKVSSVLTDVLFYAENFTLILTDILKTSLEIIHDQSNSSDIDTDKDVFKDHSLALTKTLIHVVSLFTFFSLCKDRLTLMLEDGGYFENLCKLFTYNSEARRANLWRFSWDAVNILLHQCPELGIEKFSPILESLAVELSQDTQTTTNLYSLGLVLDIIKWSTEGTFRHHMKYTLGKINFLADKCIDSCFQ